MSKRKYHRRGQKVSIWESLDWKINPDTTRETAGVIIIILGLIIFLGMFGLAGTFGQFFIGLARTLWGWLGNIVPVIFIFFGLAFLMPKQFQLSPFSVVGSIFLLLFLPALFQPINESGGVIGRGIYNLFVHSINLGPFAGILVLFGLMIVSLLITLNTSLAKLWEKFGLPNSSDQTLDNVRVNEPSRANVFRTLGENRPAQQMPQTAVTSREADKAWTYPPIDLLDESTGKASSGNIPKNVEIIKKTLADFGVDVSMGDVNVGPTVTQYTLKPADGMKLTNITSRANDLSLALAARSIRIEAPIPGKSAVGVELPNEKAAVVTLREVLESDEFKGLKSNLTLAAGRDVAGVAFATDLKKMPHLLIAGSTGSGKSVAINAMIVSLLYQNSPSDLRLILIDPKRVEFTHYNDIPHLLCPVVHDVDKTVATLRWTVGEMDRRFRLLQETSRRNIEAYNADPPQGKLPYIVLVIDELADLMAQAGNEVEGAIVRLAQMARAVGIHLVVATQRPSVDVITGLIKANITNRMAFAVASQIDSRTILDVTGAEKLLGNGDMLYIGSDLGKPRRVQGVLVTDKEITKLTDFLREQSGPQYDESISNFHTAQGSMGGHGGGNIGTEDELYNDAKETVVMAGKASASLLQRRLRVGYARAARLLDMLEEQGIIGPPEGAKPRDVMLDPVALDHERAQTQMPMHNNEFRGSSEPNTAGFHRPFQGQSPSPMAQPKPDIDDGIEYLDEK